MLAFTNTEVSKPTLIAQLKLHAKLDEIVKGKYWEDGKGCAVGCSIHGSDHMLYESKFGIPAALAYLEDTIFEGLPNGQAKKWPLQFTQAIKVGADLSRVHWQFLIWLLTDETHGVKQFSGDPAWGVAAAVDQVSALCTRMAVGEPVADDDWKSAARSAWSAASAARSAESARSAAWSARSAASAAWSAESAARSAWSAASAARSAAWSARSAAWSAAYIAMRDKILELLAAAPVPQSVGK